MDEQQTSHERRVVEEREERFRPEPTEPAGADRRYAGDETDTEDYEEEIEAERTGGGAGS